LRARFDASINLRLSCTRALFSRASAPGNLVPVRISHDTSLLARWRGSSLRGESDEVTLAPRLLF